MLSVLYPGLGHVTIRDQIPKSEVFAASLVLVENEKAGSISFSGALFCEV